jgi:hypothetical protein
LQIQLHYFSNIHTIWKKFRHVHSTFHCSSHIMNIPCLMTELSISVGTILSLAFFVTDCTSFIRAKRFIKILSLKTSNFFR